MTESTYIMAIDQGTTSSRAIIFDKKGVHAIFPARKLGGT